MTVNRTWQKAMSTTSPWWWVGLALLAGCEPRTSPSASAPVAPAARIVTTGGQASGNQVLSEWTLKGGAQNPDRYTALYDPDTITTFAGAVVQKTTVTLDAPPGETASEGLIVELMSGAESVTVFLGPLSFLKQSGLDIDITHQISVTGSRVRRPQGPFVVASSVTARGQSVALRTGDGQPLW